MSDTWNPAGTARIQTDDGKRESTAHNDFSVRPLTHNVQHEQAEHREAGADTLDAGRGQQPPGDDSHGGLLDQHGLEAPA